MCTPCVSTPYPSRGMGRGRGRRGGQDRFISLSFDLFTLLYGSFSTPPTSTTLDGGGEGWGGDKEKPTCARTFLFFFKSGALSVCIPTPRLGGLSDARGLGVCRCVRCVAWRLILILCVWLIA